MSVSSSDPNLEPRGSPVLVSHVPTLMNRETTMDALQRTWDFDLLCIGSGPAGQRAAIQVAKFGKRVAVVERWPIVGGVCVATATIRDPRATDDHPVINHPEQR